MAIGFRVALLLSRDWDQLRIASSLNVDLVPPAVLEQKVPIQRLRQSAGANMARSFGLRRMFEAI